MSYPGPVGYPTNLACDTALQRGIDTFNFQLNTGAAAETGTLQSPASVLPDGAGDVVLGLNASGTGGSVLNISSPANVATAQITGVTASVNVIGNSSSVLQLDQSYFTSLGSQAVLIGPNSNGTAPVAAIDTLGGNITLGSTGLPGSAITLNAPTTVVGTGAGGGIVVTGSSTGAAPTITTTKNAAGVLALGSSVGNVGLQVTDTRVTVLSDLYTALGSIATIAGSLSLNGNATIIQYAKAGSAGNAALANGAVATIPGTTAGSIPNGAGLYAVTIYAPSDAQTAQVSCVAYYNTATWQGGATGNPAYRIQPTVDYTALEFINTSGAGMLGTWTANVFQLLGSATA